MTATRIQLVIGLLILTLGGFSRCGPTLQSKFTKVDAIPEAKALIYVYQDNLTMYPQPTTVKINGRNAFVIRPGGYFPALVDSGEVELSASRQMLVFGNEASVTFDVNKGQVKFVKIMMISDYTNRPKGQPRDRLALLEVPPTQGESEITECRLVPPISK